VTDIPKPPVEPLPPPPGSFERVVARARYRRHRRAGAVLGVTAVFLSGIAGGMSLDDGVSGVRERIVALTADGEESPSTRATTSAVVTPEVTPSRTPNARKTRKRPVNAAMAPPQMTAPATRKVTGVAVDTAGNPVGGLYVYPGRPGAARFRAASAPAGRTGADGSFSLPCTGTPVLLSPWRLNVPAGRQAARADWAATFVGGGTDAASAPDARCGTGRKAVRTTVLPGSALGGTVTMPEACTDSRLPLWVWLHNDRSLTVRLADLGEGDTFVVGGLPPGQHTVGANGRRSTVTVGGGARTTLDVTFACPAAPPVSPSPSPSLPLPTPSETPRPDPSGSTPDPSGSTTPSSTATPARP
jgi:hypothetical protein